MTQEDSVRYTKAVQEYETHRKHFYVSSHDDRYVSDYLKDLISNRKANLVAVIGYAILVLFFGLFFGFMTKHYAGSFKYSAISVLAYYIFSVIVNCFLYINYINPSYKNSEYLDIIAFIATFMAGWGMYRYTGRPYIGIIAAILVVFGFVLLIKSMYFDNCNSYPRVDEFDSDNPDLRK